MQICILSDSHDHIPLLCSAVAAAKQQGAEAILHCGDIVAPSTLAKLKKYNLPVHAIHGNNTGDLYMLNQVSHDSDNFIHYYGQDADFELAERRIFLVHYPHYAEALAVTGKYDLVCCGHSHKTQIEQVTTIKNTTTILLNPGTVGGVGRSQATYIMGDLANMQFTIHNVPPESDSI